MTENHPITPPPELVDQWVEQVPNELQGASCKYWLFTQAARWGADQELEACCEWLQEQLGEDRWEIPVCLRLARRPKPPSLKELAMKALDEAVYMADDIPPEGISTDQADIIRRALEQLDD